MNLESYKTTEHLIEDYKEVQSFIGKSARHYTRLLTLDLLSFQLSRKSNLECLDRPRVQFLYFHHIFNDEIVKFEQVIKSLLEVYTIISYSEAVARLDSGVIDKPYLCLSSDDGFRNNLNALEVLRNYGLSCCFFINPDSIGLTDIFHVSKFCKERLFMPPVSFLNWDDIEYLQSLGHEIGSHTMGHINVAEVDIRDFEENLYMSVETLKKYVGDLNHFAFPYGELKHFSRPAYYSVFQAGFKSCASAVRGCHINTNFELNNEEILIRRDLVIFDWKLEHILYFLMRNSKFEKFQYNLFKYL
jgi:peptidoglycan/xylan/chitin deacetylase (PgdA/CDA1 family)